MSSIRPRKEIIGVFGDIEGLFVALREAQSQGIEITEVFSPVANEKLDEFISAKRSPVRFVTFTGAVLGLAGGMAFALLTTLVWNLVVGGKPVTSIIPFLVVGFEFTILLGALATFFAMLFFARLPFFKFPHRAYRPKFSNDRFGVFFSLDEVKAEKAREILENSGAESVEELSVEEIAKGGGQ
ncbi:MAG: hypothetical protein Kow0090_13730 [Myxococcota bacterium]